MTGRSARVLSAALMLLAVSGMPRLWAQTPTWNYYGDTPSAFVPFKDGHHMDENRAGVLSTKLHGKGVSSSVIHFTMDTGSTGIAISSDHYDPDPGGKNSQPGYITYSSSKITEVGYLYRTKVTFESKDSGTPIATSEVPVLVVTHVCDGKTGICNPAKDVSFFGVGFDRGGIQSGDYVEGKPPPPPAPVANANPFLNVTEVGGVPAGDLRAGYVITNAKKKDGVDPGVTLGVTSAVNSGNYAFTKLLPNTASSAPPAGCPAPCTAWNPMLANVTAGFGGSSATASMSFLPDTGVDHMLFTPPPGTGLTPGHHAPATTTMQISLPGLAGAAVGGVYAFEVDKTPKYDPHNPLVPKKVQVDHGTPFLNAGRTFFGGFDWAYDAVGGFIGYKTNGNADPSYATSNPILSLQGTVALPAGFGATTYLTDLAGNTILQAGDSATFKEVVSGTGSLTVAGGTVVLEAANTFSGGTIVTAGTLRLGPGASLASGSALTVDGGTFDLNSNNQTVGALSGSGTGGAITLGSGTLTAGDTSNRTLAAAIAGSGGLVKQGSGTLTLSGVNTYTGGTTIAGGTLQLGLGGALASTGALAINGGTFDLNGHTQTVGALSGTGGTLMLRTGTLTAGDSGNTILAAVMTGDGGSFIKQGSGILTLTAANTYTGGTTVTAGTLQGTTTSLQGNIVDNGVLVFSQSTSGTYAGTISGTGSVSVTGGGIVTFTGANTYSGGTLVSGATLVGTTASLQGNILNNGAVVFSQTTTGTYNGVLSGSGGLTKSGSGSVILAGANNYTGGTTLTSGMLQLGAGGSLAATGALVVNGGTFDLNGNNQTVGALSGTGGAITLANGTLTASSATNTVLASAISGAGGLVKQGSSVLTLSGANSYTGGTTVSDGVLQGTTTSLQGNIVDNSVVVFNQSASGTYAGVISGSGSVGVTGGGTVTFSGANSYSGGTAVLGATLQGTTTSLQGNIANSGAVIFNQAGSGTYAGTMTGTGSLTIQGGGTLILSAAHSYSGGTIVSASTLQGNSSNLQGNIANNGTVVFNQTGTGTFAANMTGTGGLTVTGDGTLIMSGSHSYSGSTTVTGATLAGTTSSLQGGILNNGAVVFDQATTGIYAGGMSGTGSLTKTGTGTVFMTGANSYSGGTTVSAGTLQGTSSSLQGNIANNAAVQFHQSTAGTFAGIVSGNGILIKSGAGMLTLTGVNVHTGGTAVLEGTLRINVTNVQGNILDHGALVFDQAALGTYTGNITGNGSVTKTGAGSLVLAGSNDYRGGTTVSAGTLQGTTDSLRGNILNNAAVVFDQPTNGTYAGDMSGTGSLILQGGGLVSLTGNNSFTGGTTLNGGAVIANTSSLSGNVVNNGTIVFNQAGSGTYAGVMSGTGSLGVAGGGTVNLTGNNTYTGPTTVSNGLLKVNGSITSNVTVGSSGMVGGSGTIFGTVVSGGALSPGNSIGTLTVAGNFTQAAGGSFQAEVNGAGQSDRVNVTGTATLLGGAVNVVVQPTFFAARTTFVLVNAAGGLTGTYASVTKDFNAPFLQPSLAYDANNVYLMLDIGGFQAAAQSPTQAAVGRVLDASAATASGDLAIVLGNLAAQNSATVLPVLTAISGQNYSSLSTALVQTGQLFMNNFAAVAGGGAGSGQGSSARRVALAEACDVACDSTAPALWGAWGGALGGLGTIGAGSSTGAVTYNAGGFAAGLDRKISPTFTAGAAVGYTTGTQWTAGFTGTSVSDTVQFGLYGLFNQGPVYLDGLAGYAYSSNQMWRSIQVPGLAPRTAIGQTGANQFFGQVETGYRFDLGGTTSSFVTPFARLQGFTGTQNAFTESGAQSLNLSVAAQTTNSLRSVLGAQIGGAFDMGWRDRLALQFRLGWSHEYADTSRPVTATLGGAPTLPFTTYGVSPQRDGALLGFSASTAVADSTNIFLRYESTLSGQDSSHALTAGFRMTW